MNQHTTNEIEDRLHQRYYQPGASKGTTGDVKCVTEILDDGEGGGKNKELREEAKFEMC